MAKKKKKQPEKYSAWSGSQTQSASPAKLTKMEQLWEPVKNQSVARVPEYQRTVQQTQAWNPQKEQDFKHWVNDKLNGTKKERSSILRTFGNEYGKNFDDKETTVRSMMKLSSMPQKKEAPSAYDAHEKRRAGASTSKAVKAAEAETKRQQELNAAANKSEGRTPKNSSTGGGNIFSNFADFAKGFFTADGEKMAQAGVRQGENMNKSTVGREIDRAATRATNSALLGLPRALDTRSEAPLPEEYSKRKGAGAVGDFVSDASGYLMPAAAGAKILRGTGVTKGVGEAAKEVAKGNFKGNVGKIAKETAKEGAMLGGSMSLAEEAIKGGLNPDQFNANQAALNIGLNTVAGAALDPLVSLAAPLARNAIRSRGAQAVDDIARSAQQPRTGAEEQFLNIDSAPNQSRPVNYVEGTQRITHHDLPEPTVERLLNDPNYNQLSQEEFGLLATQQQRKLRPDEMNALREIQQEIDLTIRDFDTPAPVGSTSAPLRTPIEPIRRTPEEAAAHSLDLDSPISRFQPKERKTVKGELQKLSTNWVDNNSALKDLDKMVTQADLENGLGARKDIGLPAENSVYKQMRRMNTSGQRAVAATRDNFVPLYYNLRKSGVSDVDLEDYALALHARDIHTQNAITSRDILELADQFDDLVSKKPKNMTGDEALKWQREVKDARNELEGLNPYKLPEQATPEWVEATLARLDSANMQMLHQQFMDIQYGNLQRARDAGFIDDATLEYMFDKHPNYVSMMRDVGIDPKNPSGRTKASNPIKSRGEGSEDFKVLPPLRSAMNNSIMTYRNAERNNLMQTVARIADEGEHMADIFREVDQPIEGSSVTAMIDGQPRHFEVPEYLVDILERQDASQEADIISNIGKASSDLIKNLSTGVNIPFHLVSAIRDSATAVLTSRTGQTPVSAGLGFLDSFMGETLEKITKGKFKSYVKDYENLGGGASQFITFNRESAETLAKELASGKKVKDNLMTLNPYTFAKNLGAMGERGARLGEFRTAKKKGLSDADALFEAVDVMDYSKSGNKVRGVNQYIPYLNAAIQGNARVMQAFRDNPAAVTAKALTYITAPTLAVYMSRFAPTTSEQQKRVIQNAPEHITNMNWLVPDPRENSDIVYKVPKPHLVAQMFANPLEHILNQSLDQNTKSPSQEAKQALKELGGILTPPHSVAGLNTLIELSVNKDFFTGYEIESQYDKNLPKSERYNAYTSELAKGIGNLPLVDEVASPAQIDHVLRKSTGSLGGQALDVIDYGSNALAGTPAKPKPLDDIFGKTVTQFEFNETTASGLRETIAKAATEEGAGLDRKEKKALKETESATSYNDQFKALNDAIKEVQEDTTMTPAEKKDAISELRNEQRRIGTSFIEWYNSIRK